MPPSPVSRLVVTLSGLFGIAVFCLALMPKPAASSFEMEVAKALLQLGVGPLQGGVRALERLAALNQGSLGLLSQRDIAGAGGRCSLWTG